jgi:hypothetical protein
MDTKRLDPEALTTQLRRALRHGARASRLVRYTPELIQLLSPHSSGTNAPIYDQAIHAETLLRQAIQRIGGDQGDALAILLGLAPGTHGTTLAGVSGFGRC